MKDFTDAPDHYSSEEAFAWASGWNACLDAERALADDLYGVVCQALVWLDRVGINLRDDEHVAEVMAHYEEARQQ